MQDLTREQKIDAWLAQAEAIRARLAPSGVLPVAELRARAPLEFFAGINAGELPPPPFNELIGFLAVEWEPGRFVFQGTPQRQHYNPLGSVHGGYAATLLDSCMGCAIHTRLEPGLGYTTTDLRVSYIRALTLDSGPVRAEGTVVHVGRSTALAEGRLYDVDGRLYATASTTCLILGR
ncbi:PaaI family thioesterase [Pseudomonas citronellolis]|uniref:PaaI family thioesterase n=1 Tax=Pseudomonas citronellolis TaxID=53408 RepID=UPI0023E3E94F|nr:PaaI family thioesterase [Pseudomonas citronellolis]MDF3935001.1 PaaI family thioesterase [Pseudomonas citronellolis]